MGVPPSLDPITATLFNPVGAGMPMHGVFVPDPIRAI